METSEIAVGCQKEHDVIHVVQLHISSVDVCVQKMLKSPLFLVFNVKGC